MRMYAAIVCVLSRQRFAPSCVCTHAHVCCYCAGVAQMLEVIKLKRACHYHRILMRPKEDWDKLFVDSECSDFDGY